MVPTIQQVVDEYKILAQISRAKVGQPCVDTVDNALRAMKAVCQGSGIKYDEPVTVLTRQRIDMALADFVGHGISRLSAWSYVNHLRGIFAQWCLPYYKEAGWDIPVFRPPTFRVQIPRYNRPSVELLASVKAWYGDLEGEVWLAATMMLEFAMRNGDVLRLREENFVERRALGVEGRLGEKCRYLSYVPHKTALSSGRRVFWPIHPDIWSQIAAKGGISGFALTDETFVTINHDLRAMGFRGAKAAYELRKICIDHVYQRYGAEMAVSISGDDIRTISHYYADPAQPNIGIVRVTDLL